jgi:hypothetical protein
MKAWIAALFVVLMLASGCGGEDTSSTASKDSSEGALTKAELIEQGDAICAKVFAVTESLNPEGTTKEAVRHAKLKSGMIKDLLDLGAPKETEYQYAEYLNAAHALALAEAEVQRIAKSGDASGLETAESGSLSAFSMFQAEAGTYGFETCAGY